MGWRARNGRPGTVPRGGQRAGRLRVAPGCRYSAVGGGQLHDANFPTDAEGRTYHLGVRRGDVAPLVLSVGSASRARKIAEECLDAPSDVIASHRGFDIHTGTFRGIPVSVVATGMGTPMMDFVLREVRAVTEGPLCVVRYGTCGGLQHARAGVGAVVVADESVMVQRNPDAFRRGGGATRGAPYAVSRPVGAHPVVVDALVAELGQAFPPGVVVRGGDVTACSFYASQGRLGTGFDDRNERLVADVLALHPNALSMQMETFHLFDLAESASPGRGAVFAGAAAIVLAERDTNAFIDVSLIDHLERTGGRACLAALVRSADSLGIASGPLRSEEGSTAVSFPQQ